MRRQSGFTLVELMVVIAAIGALTWGVIDLISNRSERHRVDDTLESMRQLAELAAQHRRLKGNNTHAHNRPSVMELNSRFGATIATKNPWDVAYTIRTGPRSEIVSTIVPMNIDPEGFRATSLSGGRTRLERASMTPATTLGNQRNRLIKKALYDEDSR